MGDFIGMPEPIYPTDHQPQPSPSDPAVELIRQKIRNLYDEESITPAGATQEPAAQPAPVHLGSNHQQFMAQLKQSGKSLAEIQTAWHNYYLNLPDYEKYEVWQEFYVTNTARPAMQQFHAAQAPTAPLQPQIQPEQLIQPTTESRQPVVPPRVLPPLADYNIRPTPTAAVPPSIPTPTRKLTPRLLGPGTASHVKNQAVEALRATASSTFVSHLKAFLVVFFNILIHRRTDSDTASDQVAKPQSKHRLQSLLFGLGCGVVVVVIFLFSFFNEVIIAPFIQPSRHINDTPVIIDTASTTITGGPQVIIPKINVQIPVDYTQTSTDEATIETALESGVVHYPSTVLPGQAGNAAYFGHSSNNIFNPGKYKFAFVLLHTLVVGDTFYLTYNSTTYAYKVFSTTIVDPSDVAVLNSIAGHADTATLITCDPPGTSLHRLIVVGDQISPDPNGNTTAIAKPVATAVTTTLPGNGPSLWSRIWSNVRGAL